MNLLRNCRLSSDASICIVFKWLDGQQTYAYASNTLGYQSIGRGFPAETGKHSLDGGADSEHLLLALSVPCLHKPERRDLT